MINQINGGVCAAKGFSANGVLCGIRKNRTKRDLALIMSEVPGSAAAVYTKNLVKEDNEISKDWELNSLHEIQNV